MIPASPVHGIRLLLAAAAPLALAACGDEPVDEAETYEAGVKDVSGGELIVTEADGKGVEDLELPETPMTAVPAETGAPAGPAPSPAATPPAE